MNSSSDRSTTLWFSASQLLCCVQDLNALLFAEGKQGKERLRFRFGLSRSCGEVATDKASYEQQNSLFQLELRVNFKSDYH